MDLILVVVLVILLLGGGGGLYRAGAFAEGGYGGVSLLGLVVLAAFIFWLFHSTH